MLKFNPYDGWRCTASNIYQAGGMVALCAQEAEIAKKSKGFNIPPLASGIVLAENKNFYSSSAPEVGPVRQVVAAVVPPVTAGK